MSAEEKKWTAEGKGILKIMQDGRTHLKNGVRSRENFPDRPDIHVFRLRNGFVLWFS